jgi:hypothetical protein
MFLERENKEQPMKKQKENKGTYKKNTAISEDEFRQKFRTETAARKYLEKTIWQGKRLAHTAVPRKPKNGERLAQAGTVAAIAKVGRDSQSESVPSLSVRIFP